MSRIQFVVDQKGKKTGVFLSYTKYHRLMEDLHDLKEVAKRRYEKTISAQELKKISNPSQNNKVNPFSKE